MGTLEPRVVELQRPERTPAHAPVGGKQTVRHLVFCLTPAEKRTLAAATEALETTVSQLVATASLEAAHRLGHYDGREERLAARGSWKDAPRRGDQETATVRLTLTFSLLQFPVIARAALAQLGPDYRLSSHGGPAPVQAFMLGATFRYLATRVGSARVAAADHSLPPATRAAAQEFLERLDAAYAAQAPGERFRVPAPFESGEDA